MRRYGCVKTPKSQMIERLVRMRRIGFRIGRVTSRKTRSGPAPSISAASTSSRDTCESAGVDRDRDERQRAPDDQQRHHRELRERRRVPVVLQVVAEVELRERVVEDAVLEVRHPVPDLDGDDDGHRPDEHEARGEADADDRADLDEQQREQRPDPDREADVDGREHDRAEERVPEDRVVEDGRVVLEPDPGALALDQLRQPVLLEREDDRACRAGSRGSPRSRRGPGGRAGTGSRGGARAPR